MQAVKNIKLLSNVVLFLVLLGCGNSATTNQKTTNFEMKRIKRSTSDMAVISGQLTYENFSKNTKGIIGLKSMKMDSFRMYGTSPNGDFNLTVEPGTYDFRAVEFGYKAVTIEELKLDVGDSLFIKINLAVDTTMLEEKN